MGIHEAYTWHILYRDGSPLNEYDETRPDGRGWADRLDKPVQSIALVSVENTLVHVVEVPEGASPVYFRRNAHPLNNTNEATVYCQCIGWKRSDEDAVYLFVFLNGNTLLSTNLNAV